MIFLCGKVCQKPVLNREAGDSLLCISKNPLFAVASHFLIRRFMTDTWIYDYIEQVSQDIAENNSQGQHKHAPL